MPKPVVVDEFLDGCSVDMTKADQLTEDGEQVDALAMYADCWGDDEAVESRRRQLIELGAASQHPPDDLPTTGAPDV